MADNFPQLGSGSLADASGIAARIVALEAAMRRTAAVQTYIGDQSITTSLIAANAVTANQIAAGAITTAALTAGLIQTEHIAASAVTAGKIAAGAVNTNALAAGAVTTITLDAQAVTTAKLAAGAVTATILDVGSVNSSHIQTATIVAADIATGTLTGALVAAGTLTATHIATGTLTGDLFAATTITGDKIAAGAITSGKLSVATLDAVSTSMGTLTAGLIRIGSSGGAKVGLGQGISTNTGSKDGIVGTDASNDITFWMDSATGNLILKGAIQSGSTGLGNIAGQIDGNANIVDNTIPGGKLIIDSITTRELAADSVTAVELAAAAVVAGKLDAGAVTAGTIAVGAVTANSLAADAIDGKTITGATIRTAASGSRVQLDAQGFKVFSVVDNAEKLVVNFPSAQDTANFFAGLVSATGGLLLQSAASAPPTNKISWQTPAGAVTGSLVTTRAGFGSQTADSALRVAAVRPTSYREVILARTGLQTYYDFNQANSSWKSVGTKTAATAIYNDQKNARHLFTAPEESALLDTGAPSGQVQWGAFPWTQTTGYRYFNMPNQGTNPGSYIAMWNNFDFDIPAGATIKKIEVALNTAGQGAFLGPGNVFLTKNNNPYVNGVAYNYLSEFVGLTTGSSGFVTNAGTNPTWNYAGGTTELVTVDDLNNNNVGIGFSITGPKNQSGHAVQLYDSGAKLRVTYIPPKEPDTLASLTYGGGNAIRTLKASGLRSKLFTPVGAYWPSTTKMMMEAWVKLPSGGTSSKRDFVGGFQHVDGINEDPVIDMRVYGDGMILVNVNTSASTGGAVSYQGAAGDVPFDTTAEIVVAVDTAAGSPSVKFWVNGVLKKNQTITSGVFFKPSGAETSSRGGKIILGQDHLPVNAQGNGLIVDDVAFYTAVPSNTSEVLNLYELGRDGQSNAFSQSQERTVLDSDGRSDFDKMLWQGTIRGNNENYVAGYGAGQWPLTRNGSAAPYVELIWTPPVNAWADIASLIGLVQATSAAYNYITLGVTCSPADADGINYQQTYVATHSQVMNYVGTQVSGLFKLNAGTTYTFRAHMSVGGGTYSVYHGPTQLALTGKGWQR